jgi:hypothetical protein
MKTIFRLLLLFFLPLMLASCGDKKESAQSCSIQLDEKKYSTVSENENCSNYERASGYLGQAGVSFANFLKTGATENLTQTLGISKLSSPTDYTTGNRGYVTKAQCLIGSDTIVNSRSCPDGTRRSGSTDELEISMFANIADFIYLSYGVLDNNLNGKLEKFEIEGFTKLQTEGIDTKGIGTGLVAYNRFEVVTGSSTYISQSDLTKCVEYNGDYTVPLDEGTDACALLLAAGSVTELRPIFKLDNMKDITAGGTLNTLVSMVSELSTISTALSSDFDSLGISSENSVRKQLTVTLSKLDNGAKDNNPTENDNCSAVSVFDVMFLLVKNAADNSTTFSELKSKNLISFTDLTTSVDSTLSATTVNALPITHARIVYAKDSPATTYTDSYEEAWSGENSLYEAMNNTRKLGTDDSVKGDGKVTFRELICVAEN